MRRVVQVRGVTGAGKTTAMRRAIMLDGGGEVIWLDGAACQRPCTVTSRFMALGDYNMDVKCAGTDRFADSKDTFKVLRSALVDARRDVVALEGMILSYTVRYAQSINRLCEEQGCGLRLVFLDVSFDTALERVLSRNGGKPINLKTLQDKIRAYTVSKHKLMRMGFESVVIDTDKCDADEVGDAVHEAILS